MVTTGPNTSPSRLTSAGHVQGPTHHNRRGRRGTTQKRGSPRLRRLAPVSATTWSTGTPPRAMPRSNPAPGGPHTSPHAVPTEIEDQIIRLRIELTRQGLDAGADTIRTHLARRTLRSSPSSRTNAPPGPPVPSVATIWQILTRRGFVTPQPQNAPGTGCGPRRDRSALTTSTRARSLAIEGPAGSRRRDRRRRGHRQRRTPAARMLFARDSVRAF